MVDRGQSVRAPTLLYSSLIKLVGQQSKKPERSGFLDVQNRLFKQLQVYVN